MNRGPPPRTRIDRQKITPSLLRVFVKQNGHHADAEFTSLQQPTKDEYQLYAWRDSTVSELLLSLRDLAPSLRANPLARYSLRLIFYDPQLSRFTSRELATLSARDLLPSNAGGQGGRRTLDDVRFVVGDWVDVAYYSEPRAGGFGAPLPSSLGGGGGGGMNGGRDALPHFGANAPRGGPGGFSIRGGFGANAGPPSRGGPVAGAPSVPTAREAWGPAPVPGGMGGHGQGRGDGRGREAGIGFGSAGRGGGYSGGGDRRPADGGWGSRGGGGGGGRDRDAPPPRDRDAPRRDDRAAPPHLPDHRDRDRRRRDSRSRSPVRRPRSRSPPPPPRG